MLHEFLIVIMLFSCMSMLYVPPIVTKFYHNYYARLSLATLKRTLEYTRTQALLLNQELTVAPVDEVNWQQALKISVNNEVLQYIKPYASYGAIYFHGFRENKRIHFAADGTTNADNGTFIFCPPRSVQDVPLQALVLNKEGRVRMIVLHSRKYYNACK